MADDEREGCFGRVRAAAQSSQTGWSGRCQRGSPTESSPVRLMPQSYHGSTMAGCGNSLC